MARERCPNSGLEVLQSVTTGADARLPVDGAIPIRGTNQDVVVAQDEWEVRSTPIQLHHHRIFTVRLDTLDAGKDAGRARCGFFTQVMIQ